MLGGMFVRAIAALMTLALSTRARNAVRPTRCADDDKIALSASRLRAVS